MLLTDSAGPVAGCVVQQAGSRRRAASLTDLCSVNVIRCTARERRRKTVHVRAGGEVVLQTHTALLLGKHMSTHTPTQKTGGGVLRAEELGPLAQAPWAWRSL